MKAIQHHYGWREAIQYEGLPRPKPGLDEVLIQVHAAGVDPTDFNFHGCNISGIIEGKGYGTSRLIKGDEVYGYPDVARTGTCAEFIVAHESEIARKPRTITHTQTASLPFASLTAWQSLFDAAHLTDGQKILIHEAAGAVGSLAVQLAKWKGAYVIGTESRLNQDFVKQLGADDVIDSDKMRFEEDVSDVDVVLDTIGGDIRRRSRRVLKKDGILVSIANTPSIVKEMDSDLREIFVNAKSNGKQLTQIAKLVDSGVLRLHHKEIKNTKLRIL